MEQVQPTETFVYCTPTAKPGVMAAKVKSRKFAILLQVVFSYLLLGCEQASAQAGAGALYLNRKEADVKTIAGNATICDGNCGTFQLRFQPKSTKLFHSIIERASYSGELSILLRAFFRRPMKPQRFVGG